MSSNMVCARCSKPSKMLCPKCKELDLKPTYFCSQDCFKAEWATHKSVHVATSKEAEPEWLKDRPEFRGFIGFTGPLRPAKMSPQRPPPEGIPLPDYAKHPEGESALEKDSRAAHTVTAVTDPQKLENLRASCRLAAEVLAEAGNFTKPGITTGQVDDFVYNYIVSKGGYPSPLNYKLFPKSCCTSINEVICHGIPDDTVLKDGDIMNLDISVYYKGFHSDVNETWLIGDNVDATAKKLVQTTYECLERAIAAVKPNILYRSIGDVIAPHAQQNGFQVVRTYVGHGVGELFHCTPNIPHYAKNKAIGTIKPGHVFTIEPMINEGLWKDKLWPDDWTSTTVDGKRSAQFEHTLLVTEAGVEVLTKRPWGDYINRFKKAAPK